LVMSENERVGEIEVLEINESAGTVRFRNQGFEQLKDITKDGVKPPTGPAPGAPGAAIAGLPGVPQPGGGVPSPLPTLPNANSSVTTFGGNSGNINVTRPIRPTQMGAGGMAGAGRTQVATDPPPMSNEEQTILMELHRKVNQERVTKGELPPLPPT